MQTPPTFKEFGKRLVADFQSWVAKTNPPIPQYVAARADTLEAIARASQTVMNDKKEKQ